MDKKFTKDDLKVGYVVILKEALNPHIVAMNAAGEMGFVDEDHLWMRLSQYNNRLYDMFPSIGKDYSVVEVYGYSKSISCAYEFSTRNRELLWRREEKPKETCDDCIHKVVCNHGNICRHFAEKK